MAAPAGSTTFGAFVVPAVTIPSKNELEPQSTTQQGSLRSYSSNAIPNQSPFPQHSPSPFERAYTRQGSSKTDVSFSEKDLESGAMTPLSTEDPDATPFSSKIRLDCHNQECTMWPSKQTLIQNHRAEKRKKRDTQCCGSIKEVWSRLSKNQKLACKIAVAVFLAGVAIAIGVGISKAVHGGYYTSQGSSSQIGS